MIPFRHQHRGLRLALAAILWLGACAGGFAALMQYSVSPGAAGASVRDIAPATPSGGERDMTLSIFVHPHCPCSRASLNELARLAHEHSGVADIRIWLVVPQGVDEGWMLDSKLTGAASAVAGAIVAEDRDAAAARANGAKTSGHTILTDREGRVLFSGGLTAARGQAGAAAGGEIVAAILAGGAKSVTLTEPQTTPVFGCPLVADDKGCRTHSNISENSPCRLSASP